MKNIKIVTGRSGVDRIYAETPPTHSVVAKRNYDAHGDSAVAISHHWSIEKALQAARIETHERNEEMVIIAFEDNRANENN